MKIAVVQMMYPKGHRRLDEEYVKILSQDHQIILVDDGKYFTEELCSHNNIERLSIFHLHSDRWEALKCFLHHINLLIVLFLLWTKRKEYDVLLFLNIHYSIYKVANWLPKKKTIIIHHNDVDVLLSINGYHKHFVKVKEDFLHVFLAEYIRENFVSIFNVDDKKTFTVHQPIVLQSDVENVVKEDIIIGLGNSTEEEFINNAINLDRTTNEKILKNKLILRSKHTEYNGKNLKVIRGFMSREDYESLYNKAKACVVFYPSHYKFRYSGIIDDALSKGLIVFTNDTICGRYFSIKYPGNVRIIKDVQDLWDNLEYPLPQLCKEDYLSFLKVHSEDFVKSQFEIILNHQTDEPNND